LLEWFLAFVAAAMFFVFVDQGLLAGLCAIAAILIAVARIASKTGKTARETGKALTKNIGKELSEAETGFPDKSILEEGAKNAADLAGQQLMAGSIRNTKSRKFAKDNYQFKFKGLGSVGEACQRLIDGFKKVFK